MKLKVFAQRVHKELDAAGFPENEHERAKAFAKTFKLPNHQAHAILNGMLKPSENLLARLIDEFEIPDEKWRDELE